MRFFGRRDRAGQRAWWPDGTVQSGGDIAGDIQRGGSYSVRFVAPRYRGSLITVTFYAVEYDELPGEFAVQRQVEWLVCENPSDPGGTEIWSECGRSDVTEVVISSAEEAEAEAREFAFAAHPDVSSYADWDGQPFYEETGCGHLLRCRRPGVL